ncbi:Rgd2p [Sugiyamaella lignohabitans]|uniref:Rgd2p n=1 Tax=Sugiyamaella lignohabitans TaxID=796027 RepID=A0A170R0A7_9ASCO|nr:Rgd2p [Sugiyamaella lignohabitans]ANB16036.1 Rgd2p [Sugiyamaella lignohabitans]
MDRGETQGSNSSADSTGNNNSVPGVENGTPAANENTVFSYDDKSNSTLSGQPSGNNSVFSSSTKSRSSSHNHTASSSSSVSNVDALSIVPNPDFANNFWSPDYTAGVNVIFEKLRQGCSESSEVLDMIQDRVNLENSYAIGLQAFQEKHKPTKRGFDKDEGASLRLAYMSYVNDIATQGMSHAHIASDIDKSVRGPLQIFNQIHKTRVDDNHALLTAKISRYHKMASQVQKLQTVYYTKCRQREDLDGVAEMSNMETGSLSTTVSSLGSELSRGLTILKRSVASPPEPVARVPSIPTITVDSPDETVSHSSKLELMPGIHWNPQQLFNFVHSLLEEVPLRSHKIAMLGVYNNVTPGDEIVKYARRRLNLTVGKAEKFGQSLVRFNLIKPVGQVMGRFVNSPDYFYQWQPKALDPPKSSPPMANTALTASINDTSVPVPPTQHKSSSAKLQREIEDADEQYKKQVIELDLVRCDLEKSLVDVLFYMQQCEKERLVKIKHALKEMARRISRPQDIDFISKRLFLHQESINPDSDLRYLVENYKTSIFRPNVVIYRNFSDNSICQTFGIDIVNVPFVIPLFIDYLREACVDSDSADLWALQSPISDIYQLRNQINNGKSFDAGQIFPLFPLKIVISTLKQLLLEMPDSVISFTVYDTIKGVFSNEPKTNHESEVEAIAAALCHMPKLAISQLKLIVNHLTSIFGGRDELTIERLSFHLAPYIFRPRASTAFNMKDKHPGLLIKMLLLHGEEVFASVQGRYKGKSRQRSYSEANRKAIVEARNKELAARSTTSRNRSRPGSPLRTDSKEASGNSPPSGGSRVFNNRLLPLTLSPSRQPDGIGGISSSSSHLSRPSPPSKHRKSQSNPGRSTLQLSTVIPLRTPDKDLPATPQNLSDGTAVSTTDPAIAPKGLAIDELFPNSDSQNRPSKEETSETGNEDVHDILASYDDSHSVSPVLRTPELQTLTGEDD